VKSCERVGSILCRVGPIHHVSIRSPKAVLFGRQTASETNISIHGNPRTIRKSLSLWLQFLISVRGPNRVTAPQVISQPSWGHAVAEYLQRDLTYTSGQILVDCLKRL